MWISFEALLITSTLGVIQSFFFGIYLFTIKKGRGLANIFLSALLLVFAARVIKSVGYYFANDHIIPDALMNVGFGCNLAIFPFLWLYLKSFLDQEYRFAWHRDSLHLIPALTILSLSGLLTDRFWLGQYGYFISLIAMLVYLPFCCYTVIKHLNSLSFAQRLWLFSLIIGVTLVWLSYLMNFVFGLIPYITGPVVFSLLVYFLTVVGLKHSNLFTKSGRYLQSAYNQRQIDECHTSLIQCLTEEKCFHDSSLTLRKIASQLNVSSNLLSETINKRTGYNFQDFINSHRIEEAKTLLTHPEYESKKIAAIAFEVGFNSLSVFNAAFKKFTSSTPSVYRKKHFGR